MEQNPQHPHPGSLQLQPQTPPRVLIFPFPAQGHVNSMLKLAHLLALDGLQITFLNTDHVHDRLLRHADIQSRFMAFSGRFQFRTISDGFSPDQDRSTIGYIELFDSMKSVTKPLLLKMLNSDPLESDLDCIIIDGLFGNFTDGVDIPTISFRTVSACCFWAYLSVPKVIEAGELPIRGEEDMDRIITKVPGMENFLRCRDLPGFCRANDISDPTLQLVVKHTLNATQAHGLIFNTFDDLEGPTLAHIRTHSPNVYAIGPLHSHLQTRLSQQNTPNESLHSHNSLRNVDHSCMTWLDSQPFRSVIYVSFGSITPMTEHQLLEFWYGLVNSGMGFLWVIRADMIEKVQESASLSSLGSIVSRREDDMDLIPRELVAGTTERGYIVEWAPQEEVLAHQAIGGFLTHSGWNSTLESIVAGVPMICWPYFADQQINSRFVSEVWKLGVDMKDVCDREIVAKMVKDLMVDRREEFIKSSAEMARLAKNSVNEGGSSSSSLDRMIKDITMMSLRHESNII